MHSVHSVVEVILILELADVPVGRLQDATDCLGDVLFGKLFVTEVAD